jgi:nicotinamidase-related amidase
VDLDLARLAVVICDMWDAHHCVSAASRVAEMAPRVNETVTALRDHGSLIVHAPSGCTGPYVGTDARRRIVAVPTATPPVPIDWNDADARREEPLPAAFSDPGPCSCESPEPCCEAETPYPWTRQIDVIGIEDVDAISDDGGEIYSLLEARRIEDVLVLGVHTNLCVLGRPFGIRQLVYLGKRPLLCRDLTDSFHRARMQHCEGTKLVVAHIERFWCGSTTSDELVGGARFRFAGCEHISPAVSPQTLRGVTP